MRKRYILLKDSPELKMGAIMEEKCDDGQQQFICITKEFVKFDDQNGTSYTRKTIMSQPEWFEEVKPLWLKVADLSIFEEMIAAKRADNLKTS